MHISLDHPVSLMSLGEFTYKNAIPDKLVDKGTLRDRGGIQEVGECLGCWFRNWVTFWNRYAAKQASAIAVLLKAFTSLKSIKAWNSSPDCGGAANLWVMDSLPKDRLDAINIPGLAECAVQASKFASGRPMIYVFGHYHFGWGVERVRWNGDNGVAEAQIFDPVEGAATGQNDR
ncbi:uncharacterized protein A1O5_12211 [Cladophialophora psammophila CBS 110553]|uniref:Uncharacterized protein n=1 Tax=Cladophialophora psammophila CBS 110553 TaxID=1182543 RepID=W9W2V1_9EURO|nr:uncharacterized protein A1O5_12211 [Cladophialophora psammophila CBS 110553]EXJ59330.1 hypothetical protein A1O5_12211 [Cladophialophora psammophila CBS 110553]